MSWSPAPSRWSGTSEISRKAPPAVAGGAAFARARKKECRPDGRHSGKVQTQRLENWGARRAAFRPYCAGPQTRIHCGATVSEFKSVSHRKFNLKQCEVSLRPVARLCIPCKYEPRISSVFNDDLKYLYPNTNSSDPSPVKTPLTYFEAFCAKKYVLGDTVE